MPSSRSSPPLRPARSPIESFSTPPLPIWNTPTSHLQLARARHISPRRSPSAIHSPRPAPTLRASQSPSSVGPSNTEAAPSVPPLPASPAFQTFVAPQPAPAPIRRSSSSSSSSSQRVSSPPPRSRSKSGRRLLPALPLSINTQLTPPNRGKRVAVDYSGVSDEVQIVISRQDSSQRQRPKDTSKVSTPPRPARRASRRSSIPDLCRELLPPRPTYARSISPSGSSISTASEAATPRATSRSDQDTEEASSSSVLAYLEDLPVSVPLGRKRDSAQRRLSALRGLVGNLDFNQPWSLSERPVEDEEEAAFFWACEGPEAELAAVPPLEAPSDMLLVHDVLPNRPRARRLTDAMPLNDPIPDSIIPTYPERVDVTPIRRNSSNRKPNSTPPRRPRHFRSSSDLHSRTPDPPIPTSRRKEVFDVASSGYSKCIEPLSPLPNTPTSTWRSSISSEEVYHRLLRDHGPFEIKRQEVMWEMAETEHAFVKCMRTVLRLFAIPLKTPQGKWIEGIPSKISELFDLLECIALAHGVISASQRDMRRRSEVLDVGAFVSMFRGWVNRLEVHEWYLLRFEAVVQLVEENVRESDSVFGEFVRMQLKEEVLGSMSLGSMLLKPVQRLTKYPLFLKRLLDVTPHPHPSQPDILSLLSKTESIILTLQATKAREEDYDQLVALESRLHDLPEGFTLAVRGRKLIGQCKVIRVLPGKDLSPIFSRARAGSLHSSRGSISSSVSSACSSPWDFSATLTPSTCRTSAFSISSSSSYCPPSRSSIVQTSPQRPGVSRSPSSASSINDSRPSTPSSLRSIKRKEEPLTMFVFDDLLIVASANEKSSLFAAKKKSEKGLRVLPEGEGGIGKIVEVKDWSGWQGNASLFTTTLVPLAHTQRNPLPPLTNAYSLPAPRAPKVKANTTCPVLSTMAQFLTTLGQATTAQMGLMSEYIVEEKGMLQGGLC